MERGGGRQGHRERSGAGQSIPGSLEPGAVADLVLFQLQEDRLDIQATILAGELVYGEI